MDEDARTLLRNAVAGDASAALEFAKRVDRGDDGYEFASSSCSCVAVVSCDQETGPFVYRTKDRDQAYEVAKAIITTLLEAEVNESRSESRRTPLQDLLEAIEHSSPEHAYARWRSARREFGFSGWVRVVEPMDPPKGESAQRASTCVSMNGVEAWIHPSHLIEGVHACDARDPPGRCEYDEDDYPARDQCVHCGEPHERK